MSLTRRLALRQQAAKPTFVGYTPVGEGRLYLLLVQIYLPPQAKFGIAGVESSESPPAIGKRLSLAGLAVIVSNPAILWYSPAMSTGHLQRLNRRFWQTWRWYRFRLFQRHRYNWLVLEWVAERPFLILPKVFNPTLFFTSEFMVRSFNTQLIPPGSRVLDMGTGSGVGAIFAAQLARQGTAGSVTAVDINPTAVHCARINIMLNEVEDCVKVREGDLFTAVPGEKFDIILFNPPYFPGEPQNMLDRAFHATGVIERFAVEVADHLHPGGAVLLVSSSLTAVDDMLRLFLAQGFTPQTVAQQNLRGETLWLHRFQKS